MLYAKSHLYYTMNSVHESMPLIPTHMEIEWLDLLTNNITDFPLQILTQVVQQRRFPNRPMPPVSIRVKHSADRISRHVAPLHVEQLCVDSIYIIVGNLLIVEQCDVRRLAWEPCIATKPQTQLHIQICVRTETPFQRVHVENDIVCRPRDCMVYRPMHFSYRHWVLTIGDRSPSNWLMISTIPGRRL